MTINAVADPAAESYQKAAINIDTDVIHWLIYDHLVHNCYSETAASFAESCRVGVTTESAAGSDSTGKDRREKVGSGSAGKGSDVSGGLVMAGTTTASGGAKSMDIDEQAATSASGSRNIDEEGDLEMVDDSSTTSLADDGSAGKSSLKTQPQPVTQRSSISKNSASSASSLASSSAGGGGGGAGGVGTSNNIAGIRFLERFSGPQNDRILQTLDARRQIFALLTTGKVADAVAYCNATFPNVLSGKTEESMDLCFQLQCQQFIECARKSAPEALKFAQQELTEFGFRSPKYFDTLKDIVPLIAYTEPEKSSPVAPYLSQQRREEVALALNSYVLSSEGLPADTALERLLRQATVLRDQMYVDASKDKKNKVVHPRWQLSTFLGDSPV
ncbi:hypothetical protein HK102_005468 [Quaeritorhiza haematococci]|nr:hypothetical protein HK102_005468 [Quaeritorhiza haematococci]